MHRTKLEKTKPKMQKHMKASKEHDDLFVIYSLARNPFRVIAFKPADGINAHTFVIEVYEPDSGVTRKTIGFPSIRKMIRLRDENNQPEPIGEHPSRVEDWNALAKNGELFWIPLPDEREQGEPRRLPGEFIVRPKNGKETSYRDKRSKLEISDPGEAGGRGMEMP